MIDLEPTSSKQPSYYLHCIDRTFELGDFENENWNAGEPVTVEREWNGSVVPMRSFEFVGLWTQDGIIARFECAQSEPLVVSSSPAVTTKTIGLWNRDVVEVFIAPDKSEPRKYFEFEAAPTGEWLDVALDSTSGTRVPDWEYTSGMEVAARIEDGRVVIAMKIPWTAFGKKPAAGDVWLGNILRCVGKDPTRGYLAWSPTLTEQPNFHVPERFGEFHFVK